MDERPFSLHERSWIQMIRERKWVFTARFIVAFAVLLAGSGTSVAQEKRVIKLPGTESLPFSDGVIAGNTLYIAGQEERMIKANWPLEESARKRKRRWRTLKES